MDGWPDGWPGLPPMYYATHCISPCLSLVSGEAEYVSCFGSGRINEDLIARHGSPFAVESAHISLRDSDVCARVYRALFDTARQYRESFDVFGTKMSIEWPLVEGEGLVLHTAKQPQAKTTQRFVAPDYAHLLPEPIRHFTTKTFLDLPEYAHLAGGGGADPDGSHAHLVTDPGSLEGHGGSHPHLVHEFVSALIEDRDPFPNAIQSANITCAGILAHEFGHEGRRPAAVTGLRLRPRPLLSRSFEAPNVRRKHMHADFRFLVNPEDVESLNFNWAKVRITLSPEVNGASRFSAGLYSFSPTRGMSVTITA